MCDNIRDKIETGYYDDYGTRPSKPDRKCDCGESFLLKDGKLENTPNFCQHCGAPLKETFLAKNAQYKAECEAYNKRLTAKEDEFRRDAIEFAGISGHPKADAAFSKAKDRSSYRSEWLSELEDLAELMV